MFEVILLSKAEKYYKKCDTVTVKRLNKCFEEKGRPVLKTCHQ